MMSSRRNGTSNNSPNNKALSKLALAMVAVVVTMAMIPLALSQGPINQFCRTSIQPPLCTTQVKGAANWHDSIKNSIESTLQLNADLQKILPEVYANFNGPTKENSVLTCTENFAIFEENLKEALNALVKNDTGAIMANAASCNWNDCQEAFENAALEFPPKSPPKFSQLLDQMFVYIDNIMAVTKQ